MLGMGETTRTRTTTRTTTRSDVWDARRARLGRSEADDSLSASDGTVSVGCPFHREARPDTLALRAHERPSRENDV